MRERGGEGGKKGAGIEFFVKISRESCSTFVVLLHSLCSNVGSGIEGECL